MRSLGPRNLALAGVASLVLAFASTTLRAQATAPGPLIARARVLLGVLPHEAQSPAYPITQAKIELGRMLYYDARLSLSQEISCNSCHRLDAFGVDGEATSPGHRGQRGDRNSPTVYNAAFHVAQFWDGRASDVEEQAKGPVLNPAEMAMPSPEHVVHVLRSIPGYAPYFQAAFPDAEEPITYENMAVAIGAFERRLVTPSRFDDFVGGALEALSEEEQAGLQAFLDSGCMACHVGPTLGGSLFQKLGLVEPYATADPGRFAVTENEADRGVFKVPSLRNVAKTGPWLHDGSVDTLEAAVRLMMRHQLGQASDEARAQAIAVFLRSLTGRIDSAYIARPELPHSGPDTPGPGA